MVSNYKIQKQKKNFGVWSSWSVPIRNSETKNKKRLWGARVPDRYRSGTPKQKTKNDYEVQEFLIGTDQELQNKKLKTIMWSKSSWSVPIRNSESCVHETKQEHYLNFNGNSLGEFLLLTATVPESRLTLVLFHDLVIEPQKHVELVRKSYLNHVIVIGISCYKNVLVLFITTMLFTYQSNKYIGPRRYNPPWWGWTWPLGKQNLLLPTFAWQ